MSNKTVVDQFSDSSFRVLAERIREVPEFEPLIKSAHLNMEEHAALPSSAFAWSDQRMFPLHTPEQAALSYLYASEKTAGVPSEVIEALENALDLYGVKVPARREKVAAAQEVSPDEYLLPERRRWRVTDAATVKMAEEALRAHKGDLALEERVEAAERLIKKAGVYGVKVAGDVYQTAGRVVSDLETVRHWVESRAAHAPEDVASAYTKLANDLSRVAPVSGDRDALLKLAGALAELDKAAGFDASPSARFYDPLSTVFNTEKRAEQTIELAGRNVSLSKLAALPETMYADCFGDDVLPEIKTGAALDAEKIAAVIPTMPSDLLSVFSRQIRAYV